MASLSPARSRSKSILIWAGGTLVILLMVLGIAVAVAESQLPGYDQLKRRGDLGQMIRMRAADGSVLVSLGPTFGRWLSYDEIPPTMRAAMIAVEDKRFRSHPGIDPIGVARSLQVRVSSGKWKQGGSTITQQLARNIFLNNKRTFTRKIQEAVLALALEVKFTKNQILELYLNRVYFGGGSYGIDAAARTFYGHGADQLSLGEATIIAGLVKAPSTYSPTADAEAAKGRAAVVLKAMVENGFISRAAADGVNPATVRLTAAPRQNSVRYFTDWAMPQLDTLIDETRDPIDVWTTLDPRLQVVADQAINGNTPGGAQGALVSLDRDGAVRAMVGGRDYVSSIYNRATQAERQPGSSFKLFVYLAALESGMKPTDTMVDEPVEIEGWKPRNSTRGFLGPVTLREAFSRSINTISAQIGAKLGFSTIADMARRFGLTSQISTYPAMVLGSSNVRLIEMTRAFASVGNHGIAVAPYGIRKVVTADGRLLYNREANDSRVLVAPWVAAEMTDLLQSAVLSGTGRAAQIGRPVAGKTGTTSSNKDGWFIGFSSGLTTGVWMGRDDARPIPGLQGGAAPARAFHDFMTVATANRPIEQFDTQVPMPDWQLEPDEEAMGLGLDGNALAPEAPLVDADGNPLPQAQLPNGPTPPLPNNSPSAGQSAVRPDGTGPDQNWLDDVLNRGSQRRPAPVRRPTPTQPSSLDSAANPTQDGAQAPQQ